MRPELSIIPAADLSTEERDVSAARRKRIIAKQGGLCKRPFCEAPAIAVDHIIPLWLFGSNQDDNLEGLCGPCHAQKTKAEATMRAKAKAQGGETGQYARRLKRGKGLIPQAANPWPAPGTVKLRSAPFPKRVQSPSSSSDRSTDHG